MADKCLHGIDPRTCWTCQQRLTPRPVTMAAAANPRTSSRQRSPASSHLDFHFDNEGRTLVVEAKTVEGWRLDKTDGAKRKTYCFSETTSAQFLGGTLRIQVSLFPRPSGTEELWQQPPVLNIKPSRKRETWYPLLRGATGTTGGRVDLDHPIVREDCFGFEAVSGLVRVAIHFKAEDGSPHERFRATLKTKDNGFTYSHIEPDLIARGCPLKLDLQVHLTFTPLKKPAPVEWSDWNQFFSGGLPGSGRRA